jgi:hypothetical protein
MGIQVAFVQCIKKHNAWVYFEFYNKFIWQQPEDQFTGPQKAMLKGELSENVG